MAADEGWTDGEYIGFESGVLRSLLLIFSYFLKADMLSDLSRKSLLRKLSLQLPAPLMIWLDALRSMCSSSQSVK